MSRTLVCDRCEAVSASDKGPRRTGKPVGWAYVTVALKDRPTGAATIAHHDLCPDCGKGVTAWLEGQP